MGRGRGKGRKSTGREDVVNGDEDKVPVQRRRGRPQKLFKGEIDEEVEKMMIEGDENPGMLNEKKRKTSSDEKEVEGIVDDLEEDGNGADGPPVRSVGFRQNGSRRKNKPRRAAEVGVECN